MIKSTGNYRLGHIHIHLYRKERTKIFNSSNPSSVKESKLFWKTVKVFFVNKEERSLNIQLIEDTDLLQFDQKMSEKLNTFFKNAILNFSINENMRKINHDSGSLLVPVDKSIPPKHSTYKK